MVNFGGMPNISMTQSFSFLPHSSLLTNFFGNQSGFNINPNQWEAMAYQQLFAPSNQSWMGQSGFGNLGQLSGFPTVRRNPQQAIFDAFVMDLFTSSSPSARNAVNNLGLTPSQNSLGLGSGLESLFAGLGSGNQGSTGLEALFGGLGSGNQGSSGLEALFAGLGSGSQGLNGFGSGLESLFGLGSKTNQGLSGFGLDAGAGSIFAAISGLLTPFLSGADKTNTTSTTTTTSGTTTPSTTKTPSAAELIYAEIDKVMNEPESPEKTAKLEALLDKLQAALVPASTTQTSVAGTTSTAGTTAGAGDAGDAGDDDNGDDGNAGNNNNGIQEAIRRLDPRPTLLQIIKPGPNAQAIRDLQTPAFIRLLQRKPPAQTP